VSRKTVGRSSAVPSALSAAAIALVLYADPVKKENAKLLFVRRDEKYYLIEVWSVLGKRVVTGEFEHRGETNNEQREVRLVYP
jgi:hypothetical protein